MKKPFHYNPKLVRKVQQKTLWLVMVWILLLGDARFAVANDTVIWSDANNTFSGLLGIVHTDKYSPSGRLVEGETEYSLTQDDGKVISLNISPGVVAQAGGEVALFGKRVAISGTTNSTQASSVANSLVVNSIQPDQNQPQSVTRLAVTGAQPFINILCKFAGVTNEWGVTTNYFNSTNGLMSEVSPALGHYFKAASYNAINLQGSSAVGWFQLAKSFSQYYPNGGGYGQMATDCIAQADPQVNFNNYIGINLIFNDFFTDSGGRGGVLPFALDGPTRAYRITWLPPNGYTTLRPMFPYSSGTAPLAHEMGHSFGMVHTGDLDGLEYGNSWDVMSFAFSFCQERQITDQTYGCVAPHPSSYNKLIAGWQPLDRIYVYNGNGQPQSLQLEPLDHMPTNGNNMLAKIPIAGTTSRYYFVEARGTGGYDSILPGPAVNIYYVDESQFPQARIQGDDGGYGAMWKAGSTYADAATGTKVYIKAATSTGFEIVINPPVPNAPSNFTPTSVAWNRVDLSWTTNSTNHTGFRLERSADGRNYTVVSATIPANATTYSDTTVSPGSYYNYRIQALSPSGPSAYSNVIQNLHTPFGPPKSPVDVKATEVFTNQINLAWNFQAGSSITGVKVERGTDGVNYALILDLGGYTKVYQDAGLTSGVTYYYRIKAYNAAGDSPPSVPINVTTLAPPAMPGNLRGIALSSTRVKVEWNANSTNQTNFIVERDISPTGAFTTTYNLNGATYSFTNTSLTSDTVYYYRVRATNAIGTSEPTPPIALRTGSINLVVTADSDSGNGSLTQKVGLATAGQTIFFDPGVTSTTIDGSLLATLKPGITISGGCDSNGPTVTVNVTNGPISFGTDAVLYGLNFTGQAFLTDIGVAGTSHNRFSCVKFSR